MEKTDKTTVKIKKSIAAVVILFICLAATTFALIYSMVKVEDNVFQTGEVEIDLNDGQPVIEDHMFLFEPGMTVEKYFFVENKGTCDIYYRLYFDNVKGKLADVLDVTVKDGQAVLFSGKASELTKNEAAKDTTPLMTGERRNLTILFHYPEAAGNSTQGEWLSFELVADATQTRNNPDMIFE